MRSLNKHLSLIALLTAGLVPAVLLTALAGGPPAQAIALTTTEFAIEPERVTIEAGKPVAIELRNEGALAHNIRIDALEVKSDTIQAGEATTVSFTAPEAGTYTIYCTVPGHEQAGMTATLEVE